MNKGRLIYNPPAWRVCPECNGKGEKWTGQFNDRGYVGKCSTCNGTGRIPICYTPEQWVKKGGKLSDDTPVYVLVLNHNLELVWSQTNYITSEEIPHKGIIIATPGQDRPDDNWRPE